MMYNSNSFHWENVRRWLPLATFIPYNKKVVKFWNGLTTCPSAYLLTVLWGILSSSIICSHSRRSFTLTRPEGPPTRLASTSSTYLQFSTIYSKYNYICIKCGGNLKNYITKCKVTYIHKSPYKNTYVQNKNNKRLFW